MSIGVVNPAGQVPNQAYINDKNLSEGMLELSSTDIEQSSGFFKVNTLWGTQQIVNKNNTQMLFNNGASQPSTGTDTTKVYENFGRFMAPFACTLVEVNVAVSETETLNAGFKFTVTVEKASYTTSPTVPVSQFTAIPLVSFTIDGNTSAKLFQTYQGSGIAIAANDTIRFKVVETGLPGPESILQLQATFKMGHV